jgi:hypothetical protein
MTNSRDAQAPGAGNYASVNGLDMYYELHGVGQPLVLAPMPEAEQAAGGEA